MPMPPNFRELGQSSVLGARTKKADGNGWALLKFDMQPEDFLRMFIEEYFLTSKPQNLLTHYNGRDSYFLIPKSLAFVASSQTHILAPLTPTPFPLRTTIK
jgi:hypothetical protein